MSVDNIFRRGPVLGWMPDADATNAPEGALLRADNIVPDQLGSPSVRMGSEVLYEDLQGDDGHTLYTATLADGAVHRLAGFGDRLHHNGVDFGVDFAGDGDFAIGDDSYQAFIARSTTKKKFDGEQFHNWGIPAPSAAPTLEADNAITDTVATFASAESPAFVINEGTATFQAGYDGSSDSALELRADPDTGRASASKTYSAAEDFLDIQGSEGTGTDLFDFYAWIEEPRKVDKITIMFGLNSASGGADPFRDDYYYFDFNFRNPGTVNVKDPASQSASAFAASVINTQAALTPAEVTNVRSPGEVGTILQRLGRFAGPRSRERVDAQQNSPAWTHLTVTRGQFNRVGGTSGLDWSTVTAFKVVYNVVPGSNKKLRLDNALWIGGGDRSMTGRFFAVYRFVRDTGSYIELSPVSRVSEPINLNQQSLIVTIPATEIAGADPQVNQIWLYLFGGFLDTYYRFAVTGNNAGSQTMRIDEFARSADGAFDAADRTRLVNQGLSIPGFTPDSDLEITVQKSEMDALIENERLEPGAVGPPDDIVAIAGPWQNRMFVLTEEGWLYPSSQTSPSNFSVYHVLDLRRYGTPLWMVETTGGIHVGMSKDIIRIGGTADESTDRISVDLYPVPLNIGNPPVDQAVFTDGSTVVYRAADGLVSLSGVSLSPVSQGQTSLLWRGQTRHGIAPLDIVTGRFRMTVDNHILYMLAPEGDVSDTDGSSNVIWRYDFNKSTWCRTTYTPTLRSLRREPDGTLLAGTADGQVLILESGTQDTGSDIPVSVLTPIMDGGNPLARKDAFDLQLHCDTGGNTGTARVYLDGSGDATGSYSFETDRPTVFRANTTDLGTFVKAQLKLEGLFNIFSLQAFNLSYRSRPQQSMALDTGYVLPGQPGDIAWLSEVEVDVISPNDLSLLVYLDDVLQTTHTVTVTPNVRTVYRVPMLRGTKARRPRLLLKTTNADGQGNIGFECYGIRVRMRQSGNNSDQGFMTVYPVGQAA